MTRTADAIATPKVLQWARERSGLSLSTAAERVGVSHEKLAAAEEGQERLTWAQLTAAAKVYRRPLAVFYRSEPPDEAPPVADFRRPSDYAEESWSPELRLALRRITVQRDAAVRLREYAPSYSWDYVNSIDPEKLPSDIEGVAVRMRAALSVSIPSSRNEREIFKAWRSAIEARGTLVFLVRRVDVAEMRGLAIGLAPFPVVAVNRGDAVRGRLFTLLHEFVHVHLGTSNLCDEFAEGPADAEVRSIETFCNAVAAAMLMPAFELLAHSLVVAKRRRPSWTELELREVAAPFGVSAEALMLRLISLEKATKTNYRELKKLWQSRARAADAADETDTSFGEPGELRTLRTLGAPFVHLVLNALQHDAIELGDVSEYLDMKLNYLPALEHEIGGGG